MFSIIYKKKYISYNQEIILDSIPMAKKYGENNVDYLLVKNFLYMITSEL